MSATIGGVIASPMRRYHSLDAARASMMLLGLVLHSAASYTSAPLGEVWPFHDPPGSTAFDILLIFIHLFRMPVFFVVAGFFGALLHERDGTGGFLRNRASRVALPLGVFWATALPLAGLGFLFAARREGVAMPGELLPRGSLLRVPILGHLWFLYDLLIFYGAAALLVALKGRAHARAHAGVARITRSLVTTGWGVFTLGILSALTLLPMQGPGLETSAALMPPPRVLAAYGVFFAFGWCVYGQRDLLDSFAGRWKPHLAAGLVAAVAYLAVLLSQRRLDPRVWHLSGIALAGLSMWLLIFGIVGLFVRHAGRPRPLIRYASDASYWMYLTHLVPVTWTAGALARIGAPGAMKFAVVLCVTTLVTIVSYHLAVRSTAIGRLLNGRRYPRGLPSIDDAKPARV